MTKKQNNAKTLKAIGEMVNAAFRKFGGKGITKVVRIR